MPAVTRPISFKVTETGCFQVISHKPTRYGYVDLVVQGVRTRAHRLIWEGCFGLIPEGMCVLHKCDNRICVCPEHLFLGTQADNMHDMAKKGRARSPRGEQNRNAKLTGAAVKEIRNRYRAGDRVDGGGALAREFEVHESIISRVVNGKAWRGDG